MKQTVLVKLSSEWVGAYLQIFSDVIQGILHVKETDSERGYLMECIEQGAPFFFMVLEQASNELIGAIEIRNPLHRSQLYCWINEKWWGTGCFKDAMHQAAQAYFEKSRESTITACVDHDNVCSYRALKKVGFIEKGTLQGPHGLQYEMVLEQRYFL